MRSSLPRIRVRSAYASAPPSRVHSGNHSQCCDHRIGSSKRTCAPGGRQRRHPCVCAGRLLPAPDRHRRSATHVRQSRRRSRTRRAVPPRQTGRCAYARAAASTCAMTGARRSYRATVGRSGVSDWQLAERSDGCRCPGIRARPRRWTYLPLHLCEHFTGVAGIGHGAGVDRAHSWADTCGGAAHEWLWTMHDSCTFAWFSVAHTAALLLCTFCGAVLTLRTDARRCRNFQANP